MKKIMILIVSGLLFHTAYSQEIKLVKNRKPNGRIIVPANPLEVESKAALVLQSYIKQISGADIQIVSDKENPAGNEVLIGKVSRPEMKDISLEELGKDGFIIRNIGNNLIIAGGTNKGVLYGAYTLLEKYLGCRKYSSSVSYVPESKSITLKAIDDTQIPTFDFRRIEYRDANVGEFADWNRVTNGREWGTWCHTFEQLLSTDEYAKSHPEYFSFYNERRHTEKTASGAAVGQLCLRILKFMLSFLKT